MEIAKTGGRGEGRLREKGALHTTPKYTWGKERPTHSRWWTTAWKKDAAINAAANPIPLL
jgi:hypothetical protein